jgi:NCAIR mutase (PurE)-related protein
VRKVSERIRVDKLRRVSASVGLGNKSSGGALSLRKKSSRRRNQRTEFTEGTSEIPSAVKSRGIAQGLSPREQRRSHRDIGDIGVSEGKRLEPLKVSKSRERILAIDLGRTRVKETGTIGVLSIGISGFPRT